MMGSAAAVVADISGGRHLISLDKGHRLEIRLPGGQPTIIEARPVTDFSAAVDTGGRLHIAAWLLSRHLMYYTTVDGIGFTRSTMLKSEGGLRLKDCLIYGDDGVTVAYIAETEDADTLVCYSKSEGDWEGKRIVEVEHPQRLAAFQFDGAPGTANIIYGVKDQNRTMIMSRSLSGQDMQEVIATVTGGLTDFCALTTGGARQACWIAEGQLFINGLRQTEESWTRSWPCLKREEGGVQCLWMENGALNGAMLGAQRARLRPVALKDALPCMRALPGELRRAIVDAQSYNEISLLSEVPDRSQLMQRSSPQPTGGKPEGGRGNQGELTLTDIVRNQAVYITRMQESLSAMERSVLRLQSEVTRLSREMIAVMKTKDAAPKSVSPFNVVPQPKQESHDYMVSAAGWKATDFIQKDIGVKPVAALENYEGAKHDEIMMDQPESEKKPGGETEDGEYGGA